MFSQRTWECQLRCTRYVLVSCEAYSIRQGQCRKDPNLNMYLATLKRGSQDLWKHNVRAARIRSNPSEEGCERIKERSAIVAMLRSTLKQFVQVEDQRPILWLSKLRYIKYAKLSEGFDDERAKLKWEEDVANPDVERQGVGESRARCSRDPHEVGDPWA